VSMQKLHIGIFSAACGWLLGLVITLGIVFLTNIADLENGYSSDVGFRLQTNAFFKGELAVRDHPMHHEHDMVWSRNGLQQAWGLGIPILRMPFEMAARSFGVDHFPDRWVFVVYMFIGVGLLILGYQSVLQCLSGIPDSIRTVLLLVATVFSVASPVLIGMLSGRVSVYEEAVGYLLFFQWALLGMLLLFAAKGQWRWFVCLCLCAGFAAYLRPTGSFPAVASVICAIAIAWHYRCKPVITIVFVASLFCLLPLLQMLLNYIRFESAFSFGKLEGLYFLPLLVYVSNFGDPFQAVSVWDAAIELLGTLFNLERIAEIEVWQSIYPEGWHWWEAPALRLREYYFTSFPSYYFLLLVAAWGVLVYRWRWLSLPLQIAIAWSTIGFVFFFAFYMYTPALGSRYLVDMAPQILTPIVMLFIVLVSQAYSRWNLSAYRLVPGAVIVVALVGQSVHVIHAKNYIPDFYEGQNQPVSYAQIEPQLQPKPISYDNLPKQYVCGQVEHNYNIPNNTWNWNPWRLKSGPNGCGVSVATTLFFPPFQCITLDTLNAPFSVNDLQLTTDPQQYRMRSGRYELIRTEIKNTGASRNSTTFCLPEGARLHHHWNQVIIGWVPSEYLRHKAVAPVKLLSAYISR